jgi:hypothetical protein
LLVVVVLQVVEPLLNNKFQAAAVLVVSVVQLEQLVVGVR